MTTAAPSIELIYSADCPNVDLARKHLREALDLFGGLPEWQEWDRAQPDAPPHVARFGSPTVLVNGADVGGSAISAMADSCRVYESSSGGLARAPDVESIVAALRSTDAAE